MNSALLFPLVFLMGFLVAIPAGPVQVEVIRRSVHGHIKPSLMVILGAFLIDLSYGLVAFFGIAPFLRKPAVQSVFWLSGSIILGVLGVLTIRHSRDRRGHPRRSALLSRKRWSFLSGISLSATNPVMILWWLSSLNIFRDFGLVPVFTTPVALTYLLVGSLGLAAYLIMLTAALYHAKNFISLGKMRQINAALGVFLVILAGYFLVHAVQAYLS